MSNCTICKKAKNLNFGLRVGSIPSSGSGSGSGLGSFQPISGAPPVASPNPSIPTSGGAGNHPLNNPSSLSKDRPTPNTLAPYGTYAKLTNIKFLGASGHYPHNVFNYSGTLTVQSVPTDTTCTTTGYFDTISVPLKNGYAQFTVTWDISITGKNPFSPTGVFCYPSNYFLLATGFNRMTMLALAGVQSKGGSAS
jgi:hypothetical protein